MSIERAIPQDLPIHGLPAADDRRSLSPRAVDRIVKAACGLLGAVDGLAEVPALPVQPAARLLSEPAARLRRELIRAGQIKPRREG